MRLKAIFVIALTLALAVPAFAQDGHDSAQDYRESMTKYRAAETVDAKSAVWLGFLQRNPDTDYTVNIVNYLVNSYYLRHLDDPAAALSFIEETAAKVVDAKRKRGLAVLTIGIHGRLKDGDKLGEIAQQLASSGEMGYDEHDAITRAAVEAEAWELALEHADAALSFATPEAIRAYYDEMGRKVDDLRVKKVIGWRTGPSIASKGWALVKLGRVDEGKAVLEQAVGVTPHYFVGVPDSALDFYQAELLMDEGKYAEALDRIAPRAIFMGGDEAKELLRRAYVEVHGGEEGLDDFLWSKRLESAKPVGDFTLPDYEGNEHKLSDLRGKVTILSFWFPT